MAMDLRFWGVRGTFPTPEKDRTRYGGHTTCSSLPLGPGAVLVIDAGSGLRDLGERIMAEAGSGDIRVDLLLTHFHLDHVIGFPFFAPIYSPRTTLTVHAPGDPKDTEAALAGLMAGRYFPVELKQTAARKAFREFESGLTVGGVRALSCPLRHPQGSVAYRLESGGASLVLATDTEHPESGVDERLAEFAGGATWLVYDAMYTPAEYDAGKKGWGHSTWLAGTELASAARAGALVLSHFNPAHTDTNVDGILGAARERFPRTFAAAQGRGPGKE
jgi:phosphoribosyl 1,2-cyclic phosphodiesterase